MTDTGAVVATGHAGVGASRPRSSRIMRRRADEASRLLHARIESGTTEVRKITLHCLQSATRAPTRVSG